MGDESYGRNKVYYILLDALAFYLSVLNGWSLILFPWYIGELFPHKKVEDVREVAEMLAALS